MACHTNDHIAMETLMQPGRRASLSSILLDVVVDRPAYSKSVRFKEDIEEFRHFLQLDRPSIISSRASSDEERDSELYENDAQAMGDNDDNVSDDGNWEIRTPNLQGDPASLKSRLVRVEKFFLDFDNTLVGIVGCLNVAFEKLVVARFTLDHWKTSSEVVAGYHDSILKDRSTDGYDYFRFRVKLSKVGHLEAKTMLICVRYEVNGQEYWDNNNMMNYEVNFIRKAKPKSMPRSRHDTAKHAFVSGRHAASSPRPRSIPAYFDNLVQNNFDRHKGSLYPSQRKGRDDPIGVAFANRYDFGASLSRAPATATIKPQVEAIQPRADRSQSELSPDRPTIGSQEYHELIQKYCFVR
jgi:hypothetical protein